jgi:hypothetical protein
MSGPGKCGASRFPRGVLLLRLRNANRTNLVNRVLELFREEAADDWVGCFVVVTERKIRILKPEVEGKP